jgi:hypothetical protein
MAAASGETPRHAAGNGFTGFPDVDAGFAAAFREARHAGRQGASVISG